MVAMDGPFSPHLRSRFFMTQFPASVFEAIQSFDDCPCTQKVACTLLPLQQVLEGVGDGVWDWDLATGREYSSPRFKAIYGFGESDSLTLAADLDARAHPDDFAQMQADREAHFSGRSPTYRNEHRVQAVDGRWIWVLTRGIVVSRDATGKPLRMVGTHTDITERKQAELLLKTTQERLELATRGSNDGLWDWDLRTNQVHFSPRFQALLGYESPDVFDAQFTLRSHLHADDRERVTRAVRSHLRGETPQFDIEYRLRCQSGQYRWFHGRGRATWAANGTPLRFAGHLTDITERVQAQANQRELEARLREAQKLEAIGTMAAGVAQDFNNLISAVLGNLDLAQRELDSGHAARYNLEQAHQAAGRARALVQQMLAFGRKQPQRMTVLDLGALVADVLGQIHTTMPTNVVLHSQPPDRELRVLADASQLQQVVMNLCTNAWQALQGRPGDVRVSVGEASDGSGALLVVQDSGAGMSAQVLNRVFEPFFTTRPSGEGSGLGLAVVHGIVKAHQGQISAHSTPNQGARFEVWLPLVAPAEPPATDVRLRSPQVGRPQGGGGAGLASGEGLASAGRAASTVAGAQGGRHVVYIDDYEAMVYLVTRMLRKRGYRVSAFERAEQALALIRANPADVDLLVTDYNMPGLSGLDVVREVRAMRADLPMVITSGHVAPGMQAEALAEGVLQVLNKQDSVEDLTQILANLLDSLPPR
jgi:PAS domain S-box-containing protein